MQTLTRMDRVVIDDYYHMTTMDDVNWVQLKKTTIIFFPLNLRVPCCTFTFTSKFSMAFLKFPN